MLTNRLKHIVSDFRQQIDIYFVNDRENDCQLLASYGSNLQSTVMTARWQWKVNICLLFSDKSNAPSALLRDAFSCAYRVG